MVILLLVMMLFTSTGCNSIRIEIGDTANSTYDTNNDYTNNNYDYDNKTHSNPKEFADLTERDKEILA